MNKFKYNVGENVRVIESGITGKVIRIGADQRERRKHIYKIEGYEEMWLREDELIKD